MPAKAETTNLGPLAIVPYYHPVVTPRFELEREKRIFTRQYPA